MKFFKKSSFFCVLVFSMVFPVQSDPLQALSISNPTAGDSFGHAITSDGNHILVSAPFKNSSTHTNAGAVYVYTKVGADWVEQSIITQESPLSSALFGKSMAIKDDHVFIAGKELNQGGFLTGVVYVYDISNQPWTLVQTLTVNNDQPDDGFGQTIAVEGNILVVSSQMESDGSNYGYVFELNNGVWQLEDVISDLGDFNTFGHSVVIANQRILASTPDLNGSGSIYVFEQTDNNWKFVQDIRFFKTPFLSRFGFSMSAFGDRLLVGMPRHNSTDLFSFDGKALLYEHNGNEYELISEFEPPDINPIDHFGYHVLLTENQAIISSVFDDDEGMDSGSVYVFSETANRWIQTLKVNKQSSQSTQKLGASLALIGNELIVGAPMSDSNGPFSGAVYTQNIDLIFVDGFQSGAKP